MLIHYDYMGLKVEFNVTGREFIEKPIQKWAEKIALFCYTNADQESLAECVREAFLLGFKAGQELPEAWNKTVADVARWEDMAKHGNAEERDRLGVV